jgi:hypothetical protein
VWVISVALFATQTEEDYMNLQKGRIALLIVAAIVAWGPSAHHICFARSDIAHLVPRPAVAWRQPSSGCTNA